MGPKIQARRHFLTNQIRIITYLFWSLDIFLFISFWAEFSRIFLFCVFSWLVEKYKSVTSMLMRFWSGISWMFLSMFLGLIILRLKKCVFYSFLSSAETWTVCKTGTQRLHVHIMYHFRKYKMSSYDGISQIINPEEI